MATLIPSLGACVSRMTTGERRLAERLEQKLDDDYRLWYDVPMGPRNTHPDFCVLHPRRGILVLEVKDWKVGSTILRANKQDWEIMGDSGPKTVINPLEQARQYAHAVTNALQRDAQLVQPDGPHAGKLVCPWSYGVVFPFITRKQFEAAELQHAIEPHRVICQDEMTEAVEAEDLQSRLWDMFPFGMRGALSLPQIDRVRWIMFPEVRVQQGALFDDHDHYNDEGATLPDIMRVMDLQQEQLARSLGDGHRVIHGVAGSGKTMILGYRAEYLAKASTQASKPILILCFNEPLGVKLHSVMQAKGLGSRVHVRHFHKWCREQLVAYGQTLPGQSSSERYAEELVQRVIAGVDRKQIPSGQYQAVMIDEGHDFAPEWLKLVTQMVDPTTNSLLVLYDDAQSIYERARSKQFSFKSVGIQAQGRTTILKINYRNTRQILHTASLVAADLLTADDKDDDGIPLLKPVSCGREGQEPLIIKLPTLQAEAEAIADHLAQAHQEGFAWGDMAVLCADTKTRDLCARTLALRKLPVENRLGSGDFDPTSNKIKVMTMKVSKGLEFPVVALPGVGHMPAAGEDEKEAARVFYVAATRATQRLQVTVSGDSGFGARLGT
ncbi:DEAD/DEAH box helicase [Rhodoferax sp.]|uniref:DEAD/DEAH box helicase n=1 Tax=Rhodoferax sp. TaxID=50421 RepID=UPI002ACE1533|nr:3'-5' exonuclease [Rhodoferax sp.]MDZ7920997.1 3'-5' exonuclease [Rhodoferax sp.]